MYNRFSYMYNIRIGRRDKVCQLLQEKWRRNYLRQVLDAFLIEERVDTAVIGILMGEQQKFRFIQVSSKKGTELAILKEAGLR